jgi:hypothetical protein
MAKSNPTPEQLSVIEQFITAAINRANELHPTKFRMTRLDPGKIVQSPIGANDA